MDELKLWFGDVFYKQVEDTITKEGYVSEYRGTAGGYTIVQLPYEETETTVHNVIDWSSVSAVVVVVLTFITCVTMLRHALFRR